jgi:hypothetical protein
MAKQRRSWWRAVLISTFGPICVPAAAQAAPPTAITAPAESRAAIRLALSLLPRRPQQVNVVDLEQVEPEYREVFLRAEAFIWKDRPVVYLTRHSPVLRAAQEGSSFHVRLLAAIIWHEMAHVDGADESEARRREEAMWKGFVLDGSVEAAEGLRYLKVMVDRVHVEGSWRIRPVPRGQGSDAAAGSVTPGAPAGKSRGGAPA